jgi:Fic family protein
MPDANYGNECMTTQLRLIQPSYDSAVTDLVMELEHLRRLELGGDTPAPIFFQLKGLFHLLESLGSARIEGNRTTLLDYVEARIAPPIRREDRLMEIENLEQAMDYVEKSVAAGQVISHQLLRELHAMAVTGLEREGDRTPGAYRSWPVMIQGANHKPPEHIQVQSLMDDLLEFVNRRDAPKYDLLKAALAHHRFAWIHPFGNGNGRVVRLFTYALLLKYGFNVGMDGAGIGRVLNPTAVFCIDRERYYSELARADQGDDKGLEQWIEYVLRGIRDELIKVDQLTRYEVLKNRILLPSLQFSRNRGDINGEEEQILKMAINKGTFKASDVDAVMPRWTLRQRTYRLKKLIDAKMLAPIAENSRTYVVIFARGPLLRGVARMLVQEGFAPDFA